VYRYRLFDAEEPTRATLTTRSASRRATSFWADDRRKLRVFDVVSVEEEDSPFVGFLKVESA
jgi:hypothetical protein